MEQFSTFCLMVIAVTFFVAALKKTQNFSTFYATLELSFKVPLPLSKPLAAIIIFIELGLSLLLLASGDALWLRIFTVIITFIFMLAPLYALISGKEIQCSCFGEETTLGAYELIRNLTLFTLSTYAYLIEPKNTSITNLLIIILLATATFLLIKNTKEIHYFIKESKND
ncbi:hypothetical protein HG263_18400 [Pseudoalteromonas sp. JBTF-M23]|uniref:Methylamine utilization protein MauE n=1 Tax=Pseudoalteromonas caenipelagi TaxID=2726988 RepID=A0A849VLL6_9GAMM|nr:MauE/DoxX family redox-associated membrane protein [Pseudoalteromonas caenipelagi]NOU52487.1 hypothetical protein [Pseudoalteromonas caenipelagi]